MGSLQLVNEQLGFYPKSHNIGAPVAQDKLLTEEKVCERKIAVISHTSE